jgi:hypothetical protein
MASKTSVKRKAADVRRAAGSVGSIAGYTDWSAATRIVHLRHHLLDTIAATNALVEETTALIADLEAEETP